MHLLCFYMHLLCFYIVLFRLQNTTGFLFTLFSVSSLTSWPPRTPTTCRRSSPCHTSLICSSCTTDLRCGQRNGKQKLWSCFGAPLLSFDARYVIQVTHQSGATIEYSPVEALKRVGINIFFTIQSIQERWLLQNGVDLYFGMTSRSPGDFKTSRRGIEFLSFVLFVMNTVHPEPPLPHITWWKTVGLIPVTSPAHLYMLFKMWRIVLLLAGQIS